MHDLGVPLFSETAKSESGFGVLGETNLQNLIVGACFGSNPWSWSVQESLFLDFSWIVGTPTRDVVMLFWFCDFPIPIVFLKVSNVAFLVFCICLAPTAVGTFLPLSASNGTLGRNWFSLLTNTWAIAGSPKAPGKNLWFCCGRLGWWNPFILEHFGADILDRRMYTACFRCHEQSSKHHKYNTKELSLGKVHHFFWHRILRVAW